MFSSPVAFDSSALSYEQFCDAWREEVRARLSAHPSDPDELAGSVLQGLLEPFLEEWNEGDFHLLDAGAPDGLNALYFGEEETASGSSSVAFLLRLIRRDDLLAEGKTVLAETGKMLRLLDAGRQHAPENWDRLFDWLEDNPSEKQVKIVFVSLQPLPQRELDALPGAQEMAASRLALECEAFNLSLETLYRGNAGVRLSLRMAAGPTSPSPDFVAGTVSLLDLWEFLRDYKAARGELDRLYDKNVRLFQGKAKKANKAIVKTLREEPHLFGMLNNGLTFVARTVEREGDSFTLRDPSVVNGCQTTRTLFDTLGEEFKKATTAPAEYSAWKKKLETGRVVVKIVQVAPGEDDERQRLLEKITRSTNLQTAVKEKDFVALDEDFQRWKREMAGQGVFLEILSNESTLQLARQKRRDYDGIRFARFAKAFDLFKIYGAAWMNEPGAAWNKNQVFLPGGRVFKEILAQDGFGGPDLLAALYLQEESARHKFGARGKIAEGPGKERLERRRLTRFVFFRTALELLRRTLSSLELPTDQSALTRALLALYEHPNEWRGFIEDAVEVVDDYMNPSHENSIVLEPRYGGDFNAFFKREDLHKTRENYPRIWEEWSVRAALLRRSASPRLSAILTGAFAK